MEKNTDTGTDKEKRQNSTEGKNHSSEKMQNRAKTSKTRISNQKIEEAAKEATQKDLDAGESPA